ncbi:MAG: murein biosynthesis integral membrane protein MurJ, partial [Tissierellia bacterium]|nr:murein biosynthesis integral membrane protein MurJ [Tissierellia bacterium]
MKKTEKFAWSAIAVVIFTGIGKVMGYVRASLIAYYFGADNLTDAYTAANSATSILSQILTLAIATTFIPVLAKVSEKEGLKGKNSHTSNMINISLLIGGAFAAIGIVFAPVLGKIVAGGFSAETFEMTVVLIRISMVSVIFSGVVGVLTGYLQSEGKFAAAGSIVIPVNLVYILYLVFMSKSFGLKGLAVSTTVGIIAQILFMVPAFRNTKFKYNRSLDITNKYVIQTLILSVPVLISTGLDNINTLVDTRLASGLAEGTITLMNNANKLNLLIYGVFTMAIVQVVYPGLSEAFSAGDYDGGRKGTIFSAKIISLITIPATVGLIVLAKPVVEIAFMRGAFNESDAFITAQTLKCYSVGLWALSINYLLNRVYYSLQDTKTPLFIAAITTVVNVVLKLVLVGKFQHAGLALAFALATNIAVLVSFSLLRKKLKYLGGRDFLITAIKS